MKIKKKCLDSLLNEKKKRPRDNARAIEDFSE